MMRGPIDSKIKLTIRRKGEKKLWKNFKKGNNTN